ncbi:MAG TPA: hypothetical protein VFK05_11125, partial [Polyangiaceae bacterium]|nr:hypothetical protein [Polyangiaceae bacterium]
MTPAPKPRAETALGSGPSRFVRALWGLDVRVQLLPPAPADSELVPRRPRFTGSTLWLPASPLAGTPGGFADYLFAASAHISAHLRFGGPRFEPKSLKPIQIAVISLVEDARVERLAAAHYPGLARLWAPYHQARAHGAKTSLSLLSRLARALHDDQYVDDDSWVSKGRQLFLAGRAEWSDESLSRRIGGALGNDLGQMRVQFNPKDYVVEPAYRDDHIGLWHFAQEPADDGTALELESRRRVEGEQARSKQHERAEPEPHRPSDEHPRERTSTLQLEAPAQAASPLRYGEWDYLIQRDRPAFCSVFERPVLPDDRTALASALPSAAYARKRLERAALRLAEQHPQRERRLLDGDRLDLPAVIATVALDRSAAQPAPRVYQRVFFRREPPALLLLLDLSE